MMMMVVVVVVVGVCMGLVVYDDRHICAQQ